MTYYDPSLWRLEQDLGDGRTIPHVLNVPVALARGHLERLTDDELTDHHDDVHAEHERRGG